MKCWLWVSFPDVISCAKFHLYCTNSFWVAGPINWVLPLTWEVIFTVAAALLSSVVPLMPMLLSLCYCRWLFCRCDNGYLQIYTRGESGRVSGQGYRLCGHRSSAWNVTTTNPRLLMIFDARGHKAGRGFAANYQFITGCVSLHLSVCLSQVGVVQKWLNLGSH